MKSVSVIIPTYNRSNFVCEAIESVMNQDTRDCSLEIIVVDDGSTDDTRSAVLSLGGGVKYIYQENRGAGVARNRGIEESSGEWVAFLDSDDRWLADKLSLQFKVLETLREFNAIHSNFYTFKDDRIIIPRGLESWVEGINGVDSVLWDRIYSRHYKSSEFGIERGDTRFDIYSGNLFGAFLSRPCAACWTLLVRRECLDEDIRFAENYPTWEDYWFFCKLSERQNVIFMNCPTAENRAHEGPRLTQTQRARELECYIDICEKVYLPSKSAFKPPDEIIRQHYRNAKRALFKEYLKGGRRDRAKAILSSAETAWGIGHDITFPFYRLAALVPFNITSLLVRAKRAAVRD